MGNSIRTRGELTPQNLPALGSRVVYEIPRTSDLESIFILLSGSFQLTVGSPGLITDGVLNVITAVELLANSGRDIIVTVPFNILTQSNMFRRKKGNVPQITQPGIGIAVNAFSVSSVLDLAAFGATVPKNSSLRENNYESLQLAFRFAGDLSGVYQAGFTNTVNVLNMVVRVKENVELVDPANGIATRPTVRPLFTSNDIILAGASNKVQFKITPGQGLRGLAFKVQTNAIPPVLSDSLINRVRLNVGKVQRLDEAGATIKAEMAQENPAVPPVGYYFVDFADRFGADDYLNDVIDTNPLVTAGADSMLEFDTSGACTISIMQYGYIPLGR